MKTRNLNRSAPLLGFAVLLLLGLRPGAVNAEIMEDLTLQFEGITRVYDLYIPGSAGGQPAALIVDLHGFQVSKTTQRQWSKFDVLAEKEGFYVAYPLGTTLQSCFADSDPANPTPGLTVEAREIAFAKTMADRDFDAFKAFISEEAIFFNGNEPLRGKSVVIAVWAHYFEGESAPFSWHPDTVEALDSGQLAISSGPVYSSTGEVVGRFNSIWRKEPDGQWRVVFDKGS